jgi:hypothetical protein
MKLICVKEDDVAMFTPPMLGNFFDGEINNIDDENNYWSIIGYIDSDGDVWGIICPKECFITLGDYREQRINKIINEE